MNVTQQPFGILRARYCRRRYTLGAQAGEAAIRQLVTDAGFTRFRRAAETLFNLIFEARP